MDPAFRSAYNAAYSPELYREYVTSLERALGCPIPFRVAETPLFLPPSLRDRLARDATEIIEQISAPHQLERMRGAVPAHLDVPGIDPLPNCVQVDFAIVREPDGALAGRVVELQAFPSLYALMVVQTDVLASLLRRHPGLDRRWSIYFERGGREAALARLRRAIVADVPVESVALLDLDPPSQKTYPDFAATRLLFGVEAVCPTTLVREGRRLFRRAGGRLVPVLRIYNRMVFDELLRKGVTLPFDWRDELDVSWCSHPNWYWIWSKFTLPHVDHPAVPRARLLSELVELPPALERYVLKPLFSFAGAGVVLDVTREDLARVPPEQRSAWLLQEKIEYAPALRMPDGGGVKAEVRMMFLRAPDEPRPTLLLDLVRLSRGKMLGVDHNRDLDWVGGSVGIWAED